MFCLSVLCWSCDHFNHLCSVKGKIATTYRLCCLMGQNRQYLFNMSYLDVFGMLTGAGVDVSKYFGVGAGVLKHGAGADSESEKCDSAHLCFTVEMSMGLDLDRTGSEL